MVINYCHLWCTYGGAKSPLLKSNIIHHYEFPLYSHQSEFVTNVSVYSFLGNHTKLTVCSFYNKTIAHNLNSWKLILPDHLWWLNLPAPATVFQDSHSQPILLYSYLLLSLHTNIQGWFVKQMSVFQLILVCEMDWWWFLYLQVDFGSSTLSITS